MSIHLEDDGDIASTVKAGAGIRCLLLAVDVGLLAINRLLETKKKKAKSANGEGEYRGKRTITYSSFEISLNLISIYKTIVQKLLKRSSVITIYKVELDLKWIMISFDTSRGA